MEGIFGNATSFNQSLNNWDVSNVTNADYMFCYATRYIDSISKELSLN